MNLINLHKIDIKPEQDMQDETKQRLPICTNTPQTFSQHSTQLSFVCSSFFHFVSSLLRFACCTGPCLNTYLIARAPQSLCCFQCPVGNRPGRRVKSLPLSLLSQKIYSQQKLSIVSCPSSRFLTFYSMTRPIY